MVEVSRINRVQNFYWSLGTSTGTLELYDVETGNRFIRRSFSSIGPRGLAIMKGGKVVVSVGGDLVVLDQTGNVLREYPNDGSYGTIKSIGATDTSNEVVLVSQDDGNLTRVRLVGDKPTVIWKKDTGKFPRGIVMDRLGNVWIACKTGNSGFLTGSLSSIYRHDGDDGTLLFSAPIPFGARGVTVDSNNEAWVTCLGDQQLQAGGLAGNNDQVVHVDQNGVIKGVVTVGLGPFGICCDVNDNKYVSCGTDNMVYKIDSTGVLAGGNWPVNISSLGMTGGITCDIDGNGTIWIASKTDSTPGIVALNPSGTLKYSINLDNVTGPETLTDCTGYNHALILFPNDDSDGDGVSNLQELQNGTNPFKV